MNINKEIWNINLNILKEKSFYGEQKRQNFLFSQKNTSKQTKDIHNLPR